MVLRLSQRSFAWRLSPSLKGKSHLRYPWGLTVRPRDALDATQVTPLLVPGFGLDVSQAQRIIAVGKLPLRCAHDITMY